MSERNTTIPESRMVVHGENVNPSGTFASGTATDVNTNSTLFMNEPNNLALLSVTADLVDSGILRRVSGMNNFGPVEADLIGQSLTDLRDLTMERNQIISVLDLALECFQEYCLEMKRGVRGVNFNVEEGTLKVKDPDEPLQQRQVDKVRRTHSGVIDNFGLLRRIFPNIWSRYKKPRKGRN